MKRIDLTNDLLNPNKILFHYGRIMEEVGQGRDDFGPVAIEIHPTAVCNHRCIHCSYKERNESRQYLPREVMDRLVDSVIKMGIRAVYFSGGGEPAMYPGLSEYINKLSSHGVECSVITNGSHFEKAGLISVADRLNYVAVSVPAIDVAQFREITGTNNMDSVLALPGKIKAAFGERSPVVGARIVLTGKNYSQVKTFLSTVKAKEFDYALFKIVRDYEGNGQGLSEMEEKALKREISECADVDERFTNLRSIFDYRVTPAFTGNCWVNQFGLIANVSTDGKVYPNIVEIDQPDFCLGDLHESDLEEIWNSQRHKDVKARSNVKWSSGVCRNCRAIAYNGIINELNAKLPSAFDPFI